MRSNPILKCTALLIFLLSSIVSRAELPEMSTLASAPSLRQAYPAAVTLGLIKVHVFPHLLTYSSPQGAEHVSDRVSLSSTGACTTQIGDARALEASSPLSFKVSQLSAPVRVHCSSPVTVEREAGLGSFAYRGDLLVQKAADNTVEVINLVSMEDYIQGVVPAEMPADWSEETFKVQAVAARTYAAYEILAERENPTHPDYDIDDTIFYQAYLGISKETPVSNQAVAETSRQVMTFDSKFIKAYFSSDAGGHTEDAQEVFTDGFDYCLGKKELFNSHQIPGDVWRRTLSTFEMTRILRAKKIISADSEVDDLRIQRQDGSGRVTSFSVSTSQHEQVGLSGPEFRLFFGLPSLLVTNLSAQNSLYKLVGQGSGHGVGMSQWGARILTDKMKYSYEQVLRFYYTGIELSSLQ